MTASYSARKIANIEKLLNEIDNRPYFAIVKVKEWNEKVKEKVKRDLLAKGFRPDTLVYVDIVGDD